MSLIDHIKKVSPIFDVDNKFIYFSINKNAQKSIMKCVGRTNVVYEKVNHIGFYNKIKELDTLILNDIFMFVIVRNPWDKAVSAFHYLQQHPKGFIAKSYTFDSWVCEVFKDTGPGFDPHFEIQYPNCFYKGQKFVNFIGHLETLDRDWLYISNKIGKNKELTKVGPSQRSSNYRSYYSNKSKDIITSIYEKDINFLQYTY